MFGFTTAKRITYYRTKLKLIEDKFIKYDDKTVNLQKLTSLHKTHFSTSFTSLLPTDFCSKDKMSNPKQIGR